MYSSSSFNKQSGPVIPYIIAATKRTHPQPRLFYLSMKLIKCESTTYDSDTGDSSYRCLMDGSSYETSSYRQVDAFLS